MNIDIFLYIWSKSEAFNFSESKSDTYFEWRDYVLLKALVPVFVQDDYNSDVWMD
jgi:hypothetical protein